MGMAGEHAKDPVTSDDGFQGIGVSQHETFDGFGRRRQPGAMMKYDQRSLGSRRLELRFEPGELGRPDLASLFARYRRIENDDLDAIDDLAMAIRAAIRL